MPLMNGYKLDSNIGLIEPVYGYDLVAGTFHCPSCHRVNELRTKWWWWDSCCRRTSGQYRTRSIEENGLRGAEHPQWQYDMQWPLAFAVLVLTLLLPGLVHAQTPAPAPTNPCTGLPLQSQFSVAFPIGMPIATGTTKLQWCVSRSSDPDVPQAQIAQPWMLPHKLYIDRLATKSTIMSVALAAANCFGTSPSQYCEVPVWQALVDVLKDGKPHTIEMTVTSLGSPAIESGFSTPPLQAIMDLDPAPPTTGTTPCVLGTTSFPVGQRYGERSYATSQGLADRLEILEAAGFKVDAQRIQPLLPPGSTSTTISSSNGNGWWQIQAKCMGEPQTLR